METTQRTHGASLGAYVRGLACLLLCLGLVGCAGTHAPRLTPHPDISGSSSAGVAAAPPQESLETFMAKVRTLSAQARPPRNPSATVEGHDVRLSTALAAAAARPAPETFRLVADEYHRLGVADRAHEYLNRALTLNPRDPATYEALARMWRDWGFAHLGLADAYRAVYYSPASAATRNTLGTVFQALGKRDLARVQYELALQLDPSAAYALNNLCYGWILDGDNQRAATACLRALELDPGLTAASNNLGLAYAAAGDLEGARVAFARAGDRPGALYNLGIAHLARRRYSDSIKAFQEAQAARPTMRLAAVRARQAEQQWSMAGGDE
jgi:Flp pilus assembly protein TadD